MTDGDRMHVRTVGSPESQLPAATGSSSHFLKKPQNVTGIAGMTGMCSDRNGNDMLWAALYT